jgi:hypothetical protein
VAYRATAAQEPTFELQLHATPVSGRDARIIVPVSERRTLAALLERAAWRRPLERTRLYLDGREVPSERWRWLRPRAGSRVVMVGCPADPGTLAAISAFFVAVGQAAASAATFGAIGSTATIGVGLSVGVAGVAVSIGTAIGTAALVAGVQALGASLMDAPSQDLASGPGQASPTLQGTPNGARPNEPYPYVLGDIQGLPPFGAFPHSVINGTESEALYLFVLGPGPLRIDAADIRVGEVPITSFTGAQVVIREGRATDGPLRLYTSRVAQQALNNVIDPIHFQHPTGIGEWIQVQVPGVGHGKIAVDLNFTQGLYRVSDSGREHGADFGLQIQYRANGGSWITATTLPSFSKLGSAKPGAPSAERVRGETIDVLFFGARTKKPFQVGFEWETADESESDVYDVRIRRVETMPAGYLSGSNGSRGLFAQVIWYAVKGYDYSDPPIRDTGIATVELRVPVNEQSRGLTSNFSIRARREARIYLPADPSADADGWTTTTFETRNPAALIRDVLQGAGNLRPRPDSRIDIDALTDFYVWCRDFDDGGSGPLSFDLFVDFETSLQDLCRTIAAAGLARFGRDAQGRFTVAFDGPKSSPVAMLNAATARGFKMEVSFPREVHGVRAQFQDREAGFEANAERIVYADGYTALNADPGKLESIRFVGVTSPALIYVHARRRIAERALRRRLITVEQDLEHLAYSTGDLVLLSHPGALVGAHWGRVKSTSSARYRDTLERDLAPYGPFVRDVSGATLELGRADVQPTHGKGHARLTSTGAGSALFAQAFETASPQNWAGLRLRIDARPVDAAALASGDGLRLRLYGPTVAHWAEWRLGTADGLSAGAWATASVAIGTDTPDATVGTFSTAAVVRVEVITNVVGAQAGRVWYFDDLRIDSAADEVCEVTIDQAVDLQVALSPSIDHRRIDEGAAALSIQTLAVRGLASFGVGSDRTVPSFHLVEPILADTSEPIPGDLVTFGVSLRAICHSKEPGPHLTARVTFVDEAPGIQSSASVIPPFEPTTMLPVPINVLGPGKPTVVQVVADERALVETRDGSLRAAIRIDLEPSTSRARPPTAGWSVKYRRRGASAYAALASVELSPSVVIDQVDELETYDVVVQAVDDAGRTSEPVLLEVLVTGKTGLPPDVEDFRLEGTLLRWSLDNLPRDIAGFEVRRGDSASTFETARRIHGPTLLASPPLDISLIEPGLARLHIKAFDLAGNESENEATLEAFVGAIPQQNQVDVYDVAGAGFPIIDQVDAILHGYEDLLPKEIPDGSLEVIPRGDGTDSVNTLMSVGGAVLTVEMVNVFSGARALRVTAP